MKNLVLLILFGSFASGLLMGQDELRNTAVSEIKWELDYQIFLKLTNDSAYSYDIRQLFHIPRKNVDITNDYIYYPVNPGLDYANEVNSRDDSLSYKSGYITLWSALHKSVGGGWIHFTNCLLYTLETGQLSLEAPLMRRIRTKWKPKPPTDSWLRTRKWKYYTPVLRKEAVKEYNLRKDRGELGDLKSIPGEFIKLMLETNDKEYRKLREQGDMNQIAKIDLVKLIMGASFMGEVQINYVRSAVLKAVKNYAANMLPSVIIFDEFDAAAVMTLVPEGYKIDVVAFKKIPELTAEEKQSRITQMKAIISKINSYNNNLFIKRLGNYYGAFGEE